MNTVYLPPCPKKPQKTHISAICTQPGAVTTGSHIVLLMSWINSLCLKPSIPPSVVHALPYAVYLFFLIYIPASTLLASSPAPAEYELHLLPVTLGGAERWRITAREVVDGLSSFSFMRTPASFLFHLLFCQSPQANHFLYHLNRSPQPPPLLFFHFYHGSFKPGTEERRAKGWRQRLIKSYGTLRVMTHGWWGREAEECGSIRVT